MSLFNRTRNSPAAAATPALQAPAKPSAVSLRMTRMRSPYASEQRWSHVGRAVVDDDNLPIDPVLGFGEERIEALPGDRRLVVHRDDDRRGRPVLSVRESRRRWVQRWSS